jgi:hypothetical protein
MWTSEVTLRLDGRELGRIPREVLFEGLDFALPDNSLLRIWAEAGPRGATMIYLTRNGHPLPGSSGDPVLMLRGTVGFFWFLAVPQMVYAAGMIARDRADAGIYAMGAAGLALAILGWLAWRRSYAATVLAVIIAGVELLVLLSKGPRDPGSILYDLGGLYLFFVVMKRGIDAVAEINAHTLPIREVPRPILRRS